MMTVCGPLLGTILETYRIITQIIEHPREVALALRPVVIIKCFCELHAFVVFLERQFLLLILQLFDSPGLGLRFITFRSRLDFVLPLNFLRLIDQPVFFYIIEKHSEEDAGDDDHAQEKHNPNLPLIF